MYICICNAVTENQVRASVEAGATSLDDLHIDLGVASCCGRCAVTAVEYLPGGRRCSRAEHCDAAAACESASQPMPQPAAQPLHFSRPTRIHVHPVAHTASPVHAQSSESAQRSMRRTALAA
ncbi:MAG: (2Fe-2S)-binding protein [Burkholderiaceae bacterium]|nr:(2Fe-2S)-binding protein [Burkholderiaceae bacterium]